MTEVRGRQSVKGREGGRRVISFQIKERKGKEKMTERDGKRKYGDNRKGELQLSGHCSHVMTYRFCFLL